MIKFKNLTTSNLKDIVKNVTKYHQKTIFHSYPIDSPFIVIEFSNWVKLCKRQSNKNDVTYDIYVDGCGCVQVVVEDWFDINVQMNTVVLYTLNRASKSEVLDIGEV